jgi:hypothetical protein
VHYFALGFCAGRLEPPELPRLRDRLSSAMSDSSCPTSVCSDCILSSLSAVAELRALWAISRLGWSSYRANANVLSSSSSVLIFLFFPKATHKHPSVNSTEDTYSVLHAMSLTTNERARNGVVTADSWNCQLLQGVYLQIRSPLCLDSDAQCLVVGSHPRR